MQIYGPDFKLAAAMPTSETTSVGNMYDPVLASRLANSGEALRDVNGDAEVIRALSQKYDTKGSLPSRPQSAITVPQTRRWGMTAYTKGIPFKYPHPRDYTDWVAVLSENRVTGGTNPGVEPALYDINGDGRPDVRANDHQDGLRVPAGSFGISEETPLYNLSNRPSGASALPTPSPPGPEPNTSGPLYSGGSFGPKPHPTGRIPGRSNTGAIMIVALGILGIAVLRGA